MESANKTPRALKRTSSAPSSSDVSIQVGDVRVAGALNVPRGAHGIIVFLHGSGSNRFSSRNAFVADALERAGFATLLVDLLTAEEQALDNETLALRFDIALLGERAVAILDWLEHEPQTGGLPLGLFGASTGTAAALIAAARRPHRVLAVVSRGGRPDLAEGALAVVRAPTLFIVGGDDHAVLQLNRDVAQRLGALHQLEVVTGASHLFEEPGALGEVARLATRFFVERLLAKRGVPRRTG